MLGVFDSKELESAEEGQGTNASATVSGSESGVAPTESESTTVGTTAGNKRTPVVEAVKPEEGSQEKGADGGPGDGEKSSDKRRYSHAEKRENAFAEIKAKSQRKIEAYEKRIAELEAQLAKPVPAKETFSNEDEYFDARAAHVSKRDALKATTQELTEEQRDLNEKSEQAKFEAHYPTEENQKRFSEAWSIGQKNGVIKAIKEDQVVGSFFRDSPLTPKLIEHFCRKPSALQEIISIRDPHRKQMELYSLEQRMKNYLRTTAKAAPSSKSEAKPTAVTPAKAKIPVLGSQVKAAANKSKDADDFASDDEVFAFVRSR